ncbi:MAG TPA: hypothetical protein VEW68_09750 [Patescibacteria group bacterium]|nr:hypothetical protein [Patescibacteria group bacterium]
MIAGLLAGQRPDGSFGVHPYSKWKGAHWRLVSLVELGVPRSSPAARAAARTVLDWVATRSEPTVIRGLERRHASIEGNALYAACRLGMAKNRIVRRLVEVLLRSQWPDGGWNCRSDRDAHHSSFHESLAPIFGLAEFHRATGDAAALRAARRTGELLLEHRLYRSSTTGGVIDSEWRHIHWPHYWHYDFFHGLRALERLGLLNDPRAGEARELLASLRRGDGTWAAGGRRYWRRGGTGTGVEAVSWADAHEIVTPIALAMLQ